MKKPFVFTLIIVCACLTLSAQGFEFIDGTDFLPHPDSTVYRQSGGMLMPSIGNIRACFIFVNAPNDTKYYSDWPVGSFPEYRNTIVDSLINTGTAFLYPNISSYIYNMSHGLNQLYGDVYTYTLPDSIVNPVDPQSLGRTVLTGMDSTIDYSLYDNWTRTSSYNFDNSPDGIADMIFIIYRFAFQDWGGWYTGIALSLLNGDYISADGTIIKPSSGVCQGSGGWGFYSAKYLALHEYQHYLFPLFHNGRLANLAGLSGNEVAWGDSKGMCAWERERLGWINYTVKLSDELITLSDYMTTHCAIRINTTDPNKYYVVENRQKISVFDEAWDRGLYIYEVNESGIFWNGQAYDGKVKVISADGRYDFTHNASVVSTWDDFRITRGDPNPSGFDERDYYERSVTIAGSPSRVYCAKKWYPGDAAEGHGHSLGDAWGDDNDAFNIAYNNVFSKWSNPGLNPSYNADFSITVIHEDAISGAVTFQLRFTDPSSAPLARPMGLDGSTSNGISHALHWHRSNAMLQPGFEAYQLYHRRSPVANWNLIATNTDDGPVPSINLSIPYNGNPDVYCISKRNYFKVRAVKISSGGESNYSDELKLIYNDYIIPNYTLLSNKSLIIGDSLIVNITGSLSLEDDSMLQIGRGSQVIVNPGATISIGNNCLIKGTNKTNGSDIGSKLIVNGSITCASNVAFTSDGDPWDGLVLDTVNQVSLNGVTFNKADLTTYTHTEIEYCDFTDGMVKQNGKDVTIANSTFNNACVRSFAKLEDSSTTISSCVLSGDNTTDAIEISSASKYNLTCNQISNYKTALAIYESKNGIITENHLLGNGIGVQLYHSVADIYSANVIENNDFGIVALRNSLWSLQGSEEPPYQEVTNNSNCQILFSYDSAPEYVEFNQLYSVAYPDKPFIICESIPADPKKILVANNYFGDKFEPDNNLSPTEIFVYEPIWEPIPEAMNASIVPLPYRTVKTYTRSGEYATAQSLIYQYFAAVPDSSILYDKSAKYLLSLERVTTDSYAQLQSYYNSQSTVPPSSVYLLQYLANYCKIETNDLQSAILWLEAHVENPVSAIDSLFAAIDIGYIYLLSDDSKAVVQGKMAHLKPSSLSSYESNRSDAIYGLIYANDSDTGEYNTHSPANIRLGKNYPNPFNPSTTITFSLSIAMHCKIEIYNIRGQRLRTLINDNKMAGNYTVVWDGTDQGGRAVTSGVYLYKLITPTTKLSAKMLLLK
ncbi:MAG: T9SS type A sorting domain-containing protein [Candidatus Cloacimonetes bacterium]|nr:T9SS type A sorting domain-containing protein [Candidatus Cloacimonadota bacterium]